MWVALLHHGSGPFETVVCRGFGRVIVFGSDPGVVAFRDRDSALAAMDGLGSSGGSWFAELVRLDPVFGAPDDAPAPGAGGAP